MGVDKSLARPTSRCILFDGENISFDVSLVSKGGRSYFILNLNVNMIL